MHQTPRRNLVIVRAGDRSLHERWLDCVKPRNWDLVVSYFGDDPQAWRRADVLRVDAKGPKWPPLYRLLASGALDWSHYDYVWLPDDDLDASGDLISCMFDIAEGLGVSLAQPALSWRSHFSHPITLSNPAFAARFTNFVEVMAPLFATPFLRQVLDSLSLSESGWGLDYVWPQLVANPRTDCAVIDAVEVTHTRPIGGPNYAAVSGGNGPHQEMHALLGRFGIEDLGQYNLGGVTRDGRILSLLDESSDAFLGALLDGYAQWLAEPSALGEVYLQHHALRAQLRAGRAAQPRGPEGGAGDRLGAQQPAPAAAGAHHIATAAVTTA